MLNNILEIKNLSKIYHDEDDETVALKNISFTVSPNEFITIIGPSGCGKSTILSILVNVVKKSSGQIVFNKDLKFAYMLQKDALFDWLNILDNCLLGLKIKHQLTPQSKKKVIKLLDAYGLKEFKYKLPQSLSGGMRQRVGWMLYTHNNYLKVAYNPSK